MTEQHYPPLVIQVLKQANADSSWSVTRHAQRAWTFAADMERKEVVEWLVGMDHPLAYVAGTAEWRFIALVEELYQIDCLGL